MFNEKLHQDTAPSCGASRPSEINNNASNSVQSKWFDGGAALTRCTSISTIESSEPSDKHWICTKCRQPTTGQKHSMGKIKSITFYCCDSCWPQQQLQAILGMIFRQLQYHLGFTTLWIPSPKNVFLKNKNGNHDEWVVIVVLLVLTLLFETAAFINVIVVRPISSLRTKQSKRPAVDFLLETGAAFGWLAVIAVMIHDGVREYPHGEWDGRLIGLIACAFLSLFSYLFTSVVTWRILIKAPTQETVGNMNMSGQEPKRNYARAIAYLS